MNEQPNQLAGCHLAPEEAARRNLVSVQPIPGDEQAREQLQKYHEWRLHNDPAYQAVFLKAK